VLHGPTAGWRRAWLVAAAAFAALLSVPVALWLFAPRRPVPARSAQAVEPSAAATRARSPRRVPRIDLPPPPLDPPAFTVEAEAGAFVAGVVLDPDGRPVEGAVVRCADRDPEVAATTDGEGRFQVDPGAEGCSAFAHHEGFAASDRVVLSARRRNTITLNSPGGIDGEVVDERGAPMQAYVIAIESYRGGATEDSPSGRTLKIEDAAGAFSWPKLPPGEYVLTAAAEGRPPVHSDPIAVEIGRTTHHVRIPLSHGGTLTGRVIDADTRAPIPGALISLDAVTFTRADFSGPTRSDESGAYTLEGAPVGPFSISVSHAGHRTRVVTGLSPRGGTLHQDVELHAGAGSELAGIGAGVFTRPSGLVVRSLVPSGPAEQAGLQVDDHIVRIEGADTSGLPLAECIQRLRGPEGTRVSVQVDRGGQRVDVTIQRRLFSQW
jgi:Carboxypeptidase regulatory-like domain/PDZ domain